MMTNQEIFDTALAGVRRQGCPSAKPNFGCAYRDDVGNACNVGHCLPDDVARYLDRELGDASIQAALDCEPDLLAPYFGAEPDTRFLQCLQSAHDMARHQAKRYGTNFMGSYEEGMRLLAVAFKLNYAAPA